MRSTLYSIEKSLIENLVNSQYNFPNRFVYAHLLSWYTIVVSAVLLRFFATLYREIWFPHI